MCVKTEDLQAYTVDGKDPTGEQNLMMQETWEMSLEIQVEEMPSDRCTDVYLSHRLSIMTDEYI